MIDGRPVGRLGPGQRRSLGAAFVPEERNDHGAVRGMSLTENAFLSGYRPLGLARRGLIDTKRSLGYAREVIQDFDVRTPGPASEARSLSGGNLQKFIVGREILQRPGVLVVAQPTWGVDAGAAAAIHQALLDLAANGAAVVVISQDLDEIFGLCDRIAVIAAGRLSPARPVGQFSIEEIGLLMGGSAVTATGESRCCSGLSRAAIARPSGSMPPPLLALVLTLLASALVFEALGRSPGLALYTFFIKPLTSPSSLPELLVKASPLILIGTGLSLGFRANVWNIGAEGQYTMGALAGGGLALLFYASASPLLLPAMILAGALGGMAWAAIPAFLRTRFNASEILTSLMLTYVAQLILIYLVTGPWRDPEGYGFPQSRLFSDAATMPILAAGTRLHLGDRPSRWPSCCWLGACSASRWSASSSRSSARRRGRHATPASATSG